MAEMTMQRMRFDDLGRAEEFPPRSEPTGRLVRAPNDPEFVQREPWPLGTGEFDAYGDPIR